MSALRNGRYHQAQNDWALAKQLVRLYKSEIKLEAYLLAVEKDANHHCPHIRCESRKVEHCGSTNLYPKIITLEMVIVWDPSLKWLHSKGPVPFNPLPCMVKTVSLKLVITKVCIFIMSLPSQIDCLFLLPKKNANLQSFR